MWLTSKLRDNSHLSCVHRNAVSTIRQVFSHRSLCGLCDKCNGGRCAHIPRRLDGHGESPFPLPPRDIDSLSDLRGAGGESAGDNGGGNRCESRGGFRFMLRIKLSFQTLKSRLYPLLSVSNNLSLHIYAATQEKITKLFRWVRFVESEMFGFSVQLHGHQSKFPHQAQKAPACLPFLTSYSLYSPQEAIRLPLSAGRLCVCCVDRHHMEGDGERSGGDVIVEVASEPFLIACVTVSAPVSV